MTLLHTMENVREDISFTLDRKNVLIISDKDLYILYGIIIIMFYFFTVIKCAFCIRVYTMNNK